MPTVLTHKERTENIEESKTTVGRVLNNTRDVRVGANWGAKDRMPRSDGGAIPPQESRGGSLKGVALASKKGKSRAKDTRDTTAMRW